jgi:hypothetical protein
MTDYPSSGGYLSSVSPNAGRFPGQIGARDHSRNGAAAEVWNLSAGLW